MAQVGKWAFIVGLVIAVVGGLGFGQSWFGWVLAVLGLIVGFLNVSEREVHGFLLAAIALIVAANAIGGLPYVGGYATNIISNCDRVPVRRGARRGSEEPVRGRQGLADRTFSSVSNLGVEAEYRSAKASRRSGRGLPRRRGSLAGIRLWN